MLVHQRVNGLFSSSQIIQELAQQRKLDNHRRVGERSAGAGPVLVKGQPVEGAKEGKLWEVCGQTKMKLRYQWTWIGYVCIHVWLCIDP